MRKSPPKAPAEEIKDGVDLRQLLKHRHTLVQMRTRVKQLQHIALNQGMQKKWKLWTQAGQELLRGLELDHWTGRRRDDLLHLLAHLERQIEELDQAVKTEAEQRPEVQLLMTHPGVGPVVGLATVLTLGEVARKLVVRLYWMLRTQTRYPEVVRMPGSPSHPVAPFQVDRLSGHPASRG